MILVLIDHNHLLLAPFRPLVLDPVIPPSPASPEG